VVVVGVAADVRAPIAEQHALAGLAGQSLCQHAPGEAGSHDQVVERRSYMDTHGSPLVSLPQPSWEPHNSNPGPDTGFLLGSGLDHSGSCPRWRTARGMARRRLL